MSFPSFLPPQDANHNSASVNHPQSPRIRFAFPSLCSPTWPYLTLVPFKYGFQPPCSSLGAFQPGALNVFHILPCTLVSLPLLPGAKLFPGAPHQQTGGGPTGSTGRKTSQLGAFYNVSQTKPRHCQITVTCSLNNCFS